MSVTIIDYTHEREIIRGVDLTLRIPDVGGHSLADTRGERVVRKHIWK